MATTYTPSVGSRFNHGIQPGGSYLTDYERPSYAPWPESNVRARPRDVDAQNLATTALRGWRFPDSRRFLWDRRPLEAGVTVCATDFLPDTEMMHTAFLAASQFLTSGTSTKSGIRLSAKWATGDDGKITLKLEKLDQSLPHGDRGQGLEHTLISCMKQGGDTSKAIGQLIRLLSDRFALTMDQCKETAKASSLYPIRCTSEISSQSLFIEGKLLCPNGMLSMTPLYGKRVFEIPLARSLQASMRETAVRPQTGFMSMDQGRALVPMLAEDAVTNGKPIVGLWASGVKSVVHPMVIAGCYMLRNSTLLKDKAFASDGAFLLLFYGLGGKSKFNMSWMSNMLLLKPPTLKVWKLLGVARQGLLAVMIDFGVIFACVWVDPGLDTLARPIGRKSPGPSIRGGSPPSMEASLAQSTGAFESKIPVPPGQATQVHQGQQNHVPKTNPWEEPSLLSRAKLEPILAQSRPPRPNNIVRPTLVLNGEPRVNGSQSMSVNRSSQRAGHNSHEYDFPWKKEGSKQTAGQTVNVTPVWQSNVGSSQPPDARSTHVDTHSLPWKSKDRSNGQVTTQTNHQEAARNSTAPRVHQELRTSEMNGNAGGELNCSPRSTGTWTETGHMGASQGRNSGFASHTPNGVGSMGNSPYRPAYLSHTTPTSAPLAAVHGEVSGNNTAATAPSPRHRATWSQTSSRGMTTQHGNSGVIGNRTPHGMGPTTFTPCATPQVAAQMNQSTMRGDDGERGVGNAAAPRPTTTHEPRENSWSYRRPNHQINGTPPVQTFQPRCQTTPGVGAKQEPAKSVFTFTPDSGGSRSTTQSGPARLRTTWTSEGIPRGDPSQNPLRATVLAQQSQRQTADGQATSRFSEPPVRASALRNMSQTAPPAFGNSRQFMPPRPPTRPTTNWMSAVQTSSPPPPVAQSVVTPRSAPPVGRPVTTPQSQGPTREAAANGNVHVPMSTFGDSPPALPPGWTELSNDPDVLKMEILQLREKLAMAERELQRLSSENELRARERLTPGTPEMTGLVDPPGVQENNRGEPPKADSIPGAMRGFEGEHQIHAGAQHNVASFPDNGFRTTPMLDDEVASGVKISNSVGKQKGVVRRENEVLINGERAVQFQPDSTFEAISDVGSSDNEHESGDDSDSDDDFLGSGSYDDSKSETSSSSSDATSAGTHDWDELATYELEAGSESDDERIYRKYGMECFDHHPPYWWLPQDMSFDSLVHMEKIGLITNSAKAWENQGKPLPKIEARGGLTFEQAMKRRNKCRKKKHAFKKQHEEKYLKDLLGEEKIVTTLEKKMMRISEGKKEKKSEDESVASSSCSSSSEDDERKSGKKKKAKKKSEEKKRAEEKRRRKKKSEEQRKSEERSKKKKSSKKKDDLVNSSDVTFQEDRASSSKSSSSRKTRKSSGRSKSK
ncbi:hypothetical protein BSKO_08571 [Bryopsis sp. KO-2023]|nr:hypothetical protein BSKO_08571 [Bryopsis sp. KO-2023]